MAYLRDIMVTIFSSRLQFKHDFEGETKVGSLSTDKPINRL